MLVCESCRHLTTGAGSRTYGLFLDAYTDSCGSSGSVGERKRAGGEVGALASATEHALPEADALGAPVAHAMAYRAPVAPASCLAVGVANGVRGGIIGAGFGAVFALASPPPAASGAVAAHVAHAALRNAGGFAAWTSMYGFSRCELVKIRRKNDMLNPALAGFLTGAVLSLATMPRAYWRFSSQQVLQNATGSAIIAVVFDVANRL